jgi:hypothetical protein
MANNPNYDGMAEPDKTLTVNTVTGNYGELPKASTKKKRKNDNIVQMPPYWLDPNYPGIRQQYRGPDLSRPGGLPTAGEQSYAVQGDPNDYDIETRSGRYIGSFVDDLGRPGKISLPRLPERKHGEYIGNTELDASNRGQRWNWNLEHAFMPPGSQWNQTVWQGADRENQWLARMLQQAASEKGSMMSPIAQVRLRGQWLSERNKAIQDYINGNWDDPERAYKDFQSAIDKIDTKLRELGEDEALLRPVPPVAGKRSQFTAQTGPSKLRKQWNYANTVNNKLNEWLTTESKPGIKKIDDPDFMGKSEVTTYLDSVYETLIKYLKESSNAMADAEKKRLQILTLTDEGHDAVVQTIKAYQKALAGVMASASAKDWSQNNRGKVNEVIEAMGFDPDQMDKATLGQQMAALGGIIVSSLSKNDELPHDVRTDLEAIQEQYDKYMENMMFAANVAPHIVASMASALGETAGNQYNDQAFVAGRQLADNLGEIEDLTDAIPRNAVPMSKLLEPPQFIVPSLAKKPKGRVSTNPESVGENKPVNTTSVPGVSFED